MLSKSLFYLTLVLALGGCDFIKKTLGQKTSDAPSAAVQTAQGVNPAAAPQPPATPKCQDGSDAQILAGDCEGHWEMARGADKNLECRYKWGPRITCPSGTVALGNAAVCYGTTIRPAGGVTKPEQCEEKFGKVPQSPNYQLTCCPE